MSTNDLVPTGVKTRQARKYIMMDTFIIYIWLITRCYGNDYHVMISPPARMERKYDWCSLVMVIFFSQVPTRTVIVIRDLGLYSLKRCRLTGIGISVINLRRHEGNGNPSTNKTVFLVKRGLDLSAKIHHCSRLIMFRKFGFHSTFRVSKQKKVATKVIFPIFHEAVCAQISLNVRKNSWLV